MSFFNWTGLRSRFRRSGQIKLRYFEDVLPVEFKAINVRRNETNKQRSASLQRPQIEPLEPKASTGGSQAPGSEISRKQSPDPDKLFSGTAQVTCAKPDNPDYAKMRPKPVPCRNYSNYLMPRGLALSGGGIRSAAVSLGALQACIGPP